MTPLRRNDPCPCGSGRRYKHCCGASDPNAADDRTPAQRGIAMLLANRPADAIPFLQTATRDSISDPSARYHLALALERTGQDEAAIDALRAVLVVDPNHAPSLERLGHLYAMHGRTREAIACHRRLAAAHPGTLMGRLSEAKALAEEGRDAELEALLRATVARFPESTDAKRLLATRLRAKGAFVEAVPLLLDVLDGPAIPAAVAAYDMTTAKRFGAGDEPVIDRFRTLLTDKFLPDLYKARVHLALGKAHDDRGEYASAMSHFDAGNGILARTQPFDRAAFAGAIERMIQATAPIDANAGSPSETPLLIVGMPRSGTTLLEQILTNHPAVASAGELGFWSENGPTAMSAPPARVAQAYEAVLRRAGGNARRIVDKAPTNFLWLGAFHRAFPRARIIHCRRHPVDTCLSNYFTAFGRRVPFAHDKGDLAFFYLHYVRLMIHWQGTLPPALMHEVRYEDLVADPEPAIRRLVAFCGLDWHDACLHPERNPRPVSTASQWQVRQPIYRTAVERWRHYEPWIGQLRELLALPA